MHQFWQVIEFGKPRLGSVIRAFGVEFVKILFVDFLNVKQSESAKKPLNTVLQDICKHEVLGDFFTDKSFNLENPQKVS